MGDTIFHLPFQEAVTFIAPNILHRIDHGALAQTISDMWKIVPAIVVRVKRAKKTCWVRVVVLRQQRQQAV
jgi:hypothetical protein